MIIKLQLTNHKTSLEEQCEKVVEEYKEIKEAIMDYDSFQPLDYDSGVYCDYEYELIENIISEGIDIAKTLQKYAKSNRVYEISHLNKNSIDYFDDFERNLDLFLTAKTANYAELVTNTILKYLHKFCEKNSIDLQEQIEKNDEKNEKRFYHNHPKGSICMNCANVNDDCSHLDFNSMQVIKKPNTVKCDEYWTFPSM